METPKHAAKIGYSIREAAEATSLGRTTLYKAISDRKLRSIRIGGRTIIPAESLHEFMKGEG